MLPVSGRAAAGHPLGRPAGRGEAIRIFTGAPMPDGADTVMMQEDCVVEDGRVRLKPGIRRGRTAVMPARTSPRARSRSPPGGGSRPRISVSPPRSGCASCRYFARCAWRCCRPATRSASPGTPLPPGAIYDANRFMLAALLAGLGCAVSDFGIRPDREAALADTLAAASAGHDLIVTSGGVSTGEEDHVKPAIERLGSLHFWRLAIKPGRPVALGQIARRAADRACRETRSRSIVTFVVLARPLILRLAGAAASPPRLFPVRAGFRLPQEAGAARICAGEPASATATALVAGKYPQGRRRHPVLDRPIGRARRSSTKRPASSPPGTMVDFLPFSEVIG